MNTIQGLSAWANTQSGKKFLCAELWLIAILLQFVIWEVFHMTILGLAFDAALLALVALVEAVVLWPVLTLAKKIAIRSFKTKAAVIRKFARLPYYAGVIFVLLLGPHLWMSAKMTVLRQHFAKIARHGSSEITFTGDYSDGRPINEMDFGGKLDEVIEMRELILIKYQFLPLPIGAWKTSTGDILGPTMNMAYVYTFLPRSVYRNLFAAVAMKMNKPALRGFSRAKVREEMDRDLARINL